MIIYIYIYIIIVHHQSYHPLKWYRLLVSVSQHHSPIVSHLDTALGDFSWSIHHSLCCSYILLVTFSPFPIPQVLQYCFVVNYSPIVSIAILFTNSLISYIWIDYPTKHPFIHHIDFPAPWDTSVSQSSFHPWPRPRKAPVSSSRRTPCR